MPLSWHLGARPARHKLAFQHASPAASDLCLRAYHLVCCTNALRRKKTPADDFAHKMLLLMLEVLQGSELPELAVGGAWYCVQCIMTRGSEALGRVALEANLCEIVMAHLRANAVGNSGFALSSVVECNRLFNGKPQRPDLEAVTASGVFEKCASDIALLADAGEDRLGDIDHQALLMMLAIVRNCHRQPGAEARIRSLALALEWCLEYDLDVVEQLGATTGSYAAQICESPHAQSSPVRRCATFPFIRFEHRL